MKKQNPLIIFLLLLAVLIGYSAFSLNSQKESERKLRLQKQVELSEKTIELAKKTAEFADLQKAKVETEKELQGKIAELETDLKTNQEQVQNLSVSVESLTKDKADLQKDIAEKQKSIEELNKKLSRYEMDRTDLLASIKKLKAAGSAAPPAAAVQPPSEEKISEPSPATPVNLGSILIQKTSGAEAKVLHVDKTYGFIILSAGSKDGLRPESAVNIIRGNKFVGKATLQKVRPTLSAAVIMPEYAADDVRIGDLITLS